MFLANLGEEEAQIPYGSILGGFHKGSFKHIKKDKDRKQGHCPASVCQKLVKKKYPCASDVGDVDVIAVRVGDGDGNYHDNDGAGGPTLQAPGR